jgi:hypothetical protein
MMEFHISEAEAREFAAFEDEVGQDASAGLDWGAEIGTFFRQVHYYIDDDKLYEILSEGLSHILSSDEIQDLSGEFQDRILQKIQEKKKSG